MRTYDDSMLRLTLDVTVAEVARSIPLSIDLFEDAAIDYCCRGASSLSDAAADAGLDPSALLEAIATLPETASNYRLWSPEPLSHIVDFLMKDHQNSIEQQMPSLRAMIEQAVANHGATSPELGRIARLFEDFATTITSHMLNEECDILPHVERLERAQNGSMPAPTVRIAQRVLAELVEHERVHGRLRTMGELALQADSDCCTIKLRRALRQFSRQVHYHVHLENNVLYPRAIAIENDLRRELSVRA
jgi:regulator of cell morphogenesis and NO signaling